MGKRLISALAIGLALGIVFFEARLDFPSGAKLAQAQPTLDPTATPAPKPTATPMPGIVLAVYRGPHWIDELSAEALAKYIKEGKLSQAEVDSRYRVGDVVEVFDAARVPPEVKPAPGSKVDFVRVPGIERKDVLYYHRPLMDKDVLVKRRQYRVKVEEPAFADLSASKDVTVAPSTLLLNLEVKSALSP